MKKLIIIAAMAVIAAPALAQDWRSPPWSSPPSYQNPTQGVLDAARNLNVPSVNVPSTEYFNGSIGGVPFSGTAHRYGNW